MLWPLAYPPLESSTGFAPVFAGLQPATSLLGQEDMERYSGFEPLPPGWKPGNSAVELEPQMLAY